MQSKYELSISTGYVPNWGVTDAVRELFQNALDNEITTPENKMSYFYDDTTGVFTISNKSSKLETDSLLLGSTTKANDNNTIGKHGEGYKIAFMVLLRSGKSIKVYNYGAKEIWNVRLVTSKRYNGQQIVAINVQKDAVWVKRPDNNLTIEVSGITSEEYEDIKNKNLHMRIGEYKKYDIPDRGSILLDESEKGNIYVEGLFVSNNERLQYGYDFKARVISLDRDRKLVDTFNITFNTSSMWNIAQKDDEDMKSRFIDMVYEEDNIDVAYSHEIFTSYYCDASDAVAKKFVEENGDNAVPVKSTEQYEYVKETRKGKPIIVSDKIYKMIANNSTVFDREMVIDKPTLRDRFEAFRDKIEDRLSDEELQEFSDLIDEL